MQKTLDELITFIAVFMGDKTRMKNPHLKAQLAELLETTIPAKEESSGRSKWMLVEFCVIMMKLI